MDPEDLEPCQDRTEVAQLDSPRNARVFWGRVARVHRKGDPLRHPSSKEWPERFRDESELDRIVEQLPGLKLAAPPDQAVRHPEMLTNVDGTPSGAEHRWIGRVLSAKRDGDYALAEILVDDEDALQAIADGFKELSLGYYARRDKENFQRSTRLDHLAIVYRGRCGETCDLQVDAADELEPHMETVQPAADGCGCPSKTGTGQSSACQCNDHAVSLAGMDELTKQLEAAKAEIAALKAQKDAAEARADQAEKDRDVARVAAKQAEKDLDGEKAARDAAEKAVEEAKTQAQKDAAEALDARVEARVDLIADASQILGKTLSVKNADGKDEDRPLSKLSDREIMTAVVKQVDGDDIAANESPEFVKGMYAGALKRGLRAGQSRKEVRQAIQQNRDSAPKRSVAKQAHLSEREAFNKMQEDMKNRHRTGR